jgi:methionyl-tRNA synthetase
MKARSLTSAWSNFKDENMKQKINFDEFLEIEKKLEIKVGKILEVEEVPKSKKLLKLTVDFGNKDVRTVTTNIKLDLIDWTLLKGVSSPFITNLEPVTMMGIESQAMILPQKFDGVFLFSSFCTGAQLL